MNKIDPNTGDVVKFSNSIDCSGPCFTQQSAKDECDINLIVERAKRGADLTHVRNTAPMYGDFTNLPSYKDALLMVNKAREMFMSLDAVVRERFANDPGRLLDFLADGRNRDEAIKLGLIDVPKPPEVDPHLEMLRSIDVSLKGNKKKGVGGHGKGPEADGDE